jgi:hypothetical protein
MDAPALDDEALEQAFDAITDPEDLLVANDGPEVAEPPSATTVTFDGDDPTEGEQVVPLSGVGDRPTPTLRAGESVVLATAAGIVIRRSRRR